MDSHKESQSGKFVEILGSYNARHGKPQFKAERVKHWISVGAQVSGTVHNLLINQKIIEGKKINVLPKRKPKAEEPAEELKDETKAEPKVEEGEVKEEKTEEPEAKEEKVEEKKDEKLDAPAT